MEIFLVGGAVRDELLGIKPKDKDFVVTNSTPEEMRSLGFQEVGQSFAVYLHPKTMQEYALIRGENLVDDLTRRDLTINAIAKNQAGELIDPFRGKSDLENKILRHVSPFFAEDPLRVFRIARFQAWLPDFRIAEETRSFIRALTKTPEFTQISSERLFKEMKSALKTSKPSLFFETLKSLDALTFYFEELALLSCNGWLETMRLLDKLEDPLVRYSAIFHLMTESEVNGLGERLKVPNDWMEAAKIVAKFYSKVERIADMNAISIVQMFYEMDSFRKPHLVKVLSLICVNRKAARILEDCFEKIRNIKLDSSQFHLEGKAIGDEIREKRIRVLASEVD